MIDEVKSYEARCKVCNSPNRAFYEEEYVDSEGKLTWTRLAEMASEKQEDISLMSFKRHFESHFSLKIHEFMAKEETIDKIVEEKKSEAVNAVEEIKNNLNILKSLIERIGKVSLDNPSAVTAWSTLLREHRQTIEACERLSSSLKTKVGISRAELIREIIRSGQDLCPDCQGKFMVKLSKRLDKRGLIDEQ